MRRFGLLAVLGLALGLALTMGMNMADACRCMPVPWRLTLVEASDGVDRAAWDFENTELRQYTWDNVIVSPDHFDMRMGPK
jgi:hypothetical protein